jgi:hypothetical protein
MCLVNNEKKYTRFAGNFKNHADAPLRFGAHRPIEHDQWLPAEPLNVSIGRLFAPYRPGTSTMVIDGGDTTNTIKKNF